MVKDTSQLSMGTPKTAELPDITYDPFAYTPVTIQAPPEEVAVGGFEYVPQVDNLPTSNSEEPGFPTQVVHKKFPSSP